MSERQTCRRCGGYGDAQPCPMYGIIFEPRCSACNGSGMVNAGVETHREPPPLWPASPRPSPDPDPSP